MTQKIKNGLLNWRMYLSSPVHIIYFLISLSILLFSAKYCKAYIAEFTTRQGMILNDPLLSQFKAQDFSTIIFVLFHLGIVLCFASFYNNPRELSVAFQAYALLMLFRTLTIYLWPLQAPTDMIFLRDPFAEIYMHHNGNRVVNDLFFSGHVSSSFLFFIVAKGKQVKRILLFITISVAVMILWQKVHYTIDVLAAPFFSLLAVKSISYINEKIHAAWIPPIEVMQVEIAQTQQEEVASA